MPISRVRSVTVASMMFMMPMPPTISEIDAIAPSNQREERCVFSAVSQQVQRHGQLEVLLRVKLLQQR